MHGFTHRPAVHHHDSSSSSSTEVSIYDWSTGKRLAGTGPLDPQDVRGCSVVTVHLSQVRRGQGCYPEVVDVGTLASRGQAE